MGEKTILGVVDFRAHLGNTRFKQYIYEVTVEASTEIDNQFFAVGQKAHFIETFYPELLPKDPLLSDRTKAYYFDLNYEVNVKFRQFVIVSVATYQWLCTPSVEVSPSRYSTQTTSLSQLPFGMNLKL